MATTIDQTFIKQFEREVHEAYQRQGSKLRNSVRTINQVKGSSAVFQKVGKGTASTKSTHVYKRSEDKKIFSNDLVNEVIERIKPTLKIPSAEKINSKQSIKFND